MEKEKALLIGVNLSNEDNFAEQMIELERLATSSDYLVKGSIVQNLKEINITYFVGYGKLEEIKEAILDKKIDIVIFNGELSPIQKRNLEKVLSVEVIDRTMLILEIFSKRASSKEAKIQVRLAYLQFMLPRLIGSTSYLDRQSGGKNKGLGEKKLELNRRQIEKEIVRLKRQLVQINKQADTKNKRKNKSFLPKVSLVGYTNAGKSSLMNVFIKLFSSNNDKKVYEKDLLFATLDTTSRRIELSSNKVFILSDTVGFISALPTLLIEAFNSTLKELKNSDLLLHVIDFSSPNYKEQMNVTLETLKQIGADDIPIINVYNKIDLPTNNIFYQDEHGVYVSCTSQEGIYDLVNKVKEVLFSNYVSCKMLIPYGDKLFSYMCKNARILKREDKEDGILLEVECFKTDYYRFIKYVVQ